MSERIVALEESVAAGIAAGEVVERPASIVKELVENSLDSGARRIAVAYDDDPELRISVTDDGRGIAGNQLELAVARHATSKLRSLDDLARVDTFGFRGEALASIAAVSRFELVSRPSGQDAGSAIFVDHGRVGRPTVAGARPGTRVSIAELFANVPARRKFLKTAGAEYALAADGLRRFALARPDLHLRLERNGRTVFEHPPVGGLSERLRQVYGQEVARQMVEVTGSYRGLSLRGALSPAGVSWGSGRRVSLFVNGRWVQDRALFRAVMEAYRTYLLKGRYPAAALFVDVDPAVVDVNVHPAKLEVRFSEPDVVTAFIIESIRETLRGAASPLGRWGLTERDLIASERREDRRPVQARSIATSAAPAREIPGYRPAAPSIDGSHGRIEEEQPPLFDASSPLATLEVVGQVFAGYIVCQGADQVVLIDQHAAHERILFERLIAAAGRGTVESQGMLAPIRVVVGGDGVEAVARFAAPLADLGWDLDVFGDEDVVVRAIPSLVAGASVEALVERLVADLVRTEPGAAGRRLVDQVMATVACHAAVRVGKRLSTEVARGLIAEMGSVEFSACCPHGRPVARALTRAGIEHLFGR